jgi:hypothetical protein
MPGRDSNRQAGALPMTHVTPQWATPRPNELRHTPNELRHIPMSHAAPQWATPHPAEVRHSPMSYATLQWATPHPTPLFQGGAQTVECGDHWCKWYGLALTLTRLLSYSLSTTCHHTCRYQEYLNIHKSVVLKNVVAIRLAYKGASISWYHLCWLRFIYEILKSMRRSSKKKIGAVRCRCNQLCLIVEDIHR